ncbi:increased DNA methylation 1-like [Pistacia vera]|uniref:increased DNA methylation 1-like n=1 Tax=Pistacia vera TaxID=55513 RepID=UPI0012639C8D|nr:increased DNA methylation 1-like [Pistacia vera]
MENFVDDEVLHTYYQCLRSRGEVKVKNYAPDKWFCSNRFEHIFTCLHKLSRTPISLGGDNLTWRLLKNGKVLKENQRKLNEAIDVMHECFEPAVDPLTGRDLALDVILNSKSKTKDKNFQGFYTFVLEKKGEIVSVATVECLKRLLRCH